MAHIDGIGLATPPGPVRKALLVAGLSGEELRHPLNATSAHGALRWATDDLP